MSLKRDSALGSLWIGGASAAGSVLQFIAITVVLGGALSPAEFGQIAALTVAVNLGFILCDLGLGPAIIQRRDLSDEDAHAAVWAAMALSFVVAALMAALLGWGAGRLYWASLRPEMLWLPVVVALFGLGVGSRALLLRAMRYRAVSAAEALGAAAFAGGVCVSAWREPGPMSLVHGFLSRQIVDSGLCLWLSGWRPRRPRLRWGVLGGMARFGSLMTGTEMTIYAKASVAVPMIGARLGETALGLYNMTELLVVFPLTRARSWLTRAMFPAFARAQGDEERMRRGFCLFLRYQAMAALPAMAGLALTAPEIVAALLDPKWASAAALVQIRCVFGMAFALQWGGLIFRAKGRPGLEWAFQAVAAVAMGSGLWAACAWGLEAAIWTHAALGWAVCLANMWLAGRIIRLSLAEMFSDLWRPAAATAGMAALLAAGRLVMPAGVPAWGALTLYVGAGAAAYLILLRILCPDLKAELREHFGRGDERKAGS